jgi:hypothetical protein
MTVLSVTLFGQFRYNHPEIDWQTFDTDHFQIHFYDGTESTAREGAYVAEQIFPHVTALYDYEPQTKTDIIFTDVDDFSNGAAYYYDNKIIIWASPLDFELRGSHRWLQNVITHEFAHIVSLQKSMKAGMKFPGAYFQWIEYEDEKRPDVLYGFPQKLVSYPLPGAVVPPWLAEGSAQYMFEGADWDHWDSHRDMILRDRTLNDNLLTFTEMNTFGKKGIGNESTYNAGFAFCKYIAEKYGAESLKHIMVELSNPFQFSISKAIEKATGVNGRQLYKDFKFSLEKEYNDLIKFVRSNEVKGEILISNGTANLHPKWSPGGKKIAYISNKENDYFGQTDLFLYDLEKQESEKLDGGALFAPSWHTSGNYIYYTKKPTIPNRHGSKYFDIYEYDLEKKKEKRITRHQRAYNPVFISSDSSLAFLSSHDGSQNIYYLSLKTEKISKLTDFDDHSILRGLSYDPENHRLLYNRTQHHYRDIYFYSFMDSSTEVLFANELWDERDINYSNGELIYSDDRSGIYNLRIDDEHYVTNVSGGAFMPDLNDNGEIVYSLYENGQYKIALLSDPKIVENDIVGYSPNYFMRNSGYSDPIVKHDDTDSKTYTDDFTTMFVLPRLMVDYETVKPGFYFYSSEVLERLNVFGGATVNKVKDVDLFFIFEFNRFYPTLFAEVFYLTRNIQQTNFYSSYQIDDNLKFRLTQFNAGMRFPLFGVSQIELFSTWQVYRAFVKETIQQENLMAGVAYDYYRGWINGVKWQLNNVKRLADSNINPAKGYTANVSVMYEENDFITGLNLSDAGTLVADFADNNTWRINLDGSYHISIPYTNRWTVSLGTQIGWLSNDDVDPFFNFFGGGMIGMKGYPFYSIEGTRQLISNISLRIPLFTQKHIQLGWFILQNSVLGFVYQTGNAWSGDFDNIDLLRSSGIQWRFNGFSFYNFPTAIELEMHRGLDKFDKTVNDETFMYGVEDRFYFKLLFGF